jgi:hypothetical protein
LLTWTWTLLFCYLLVHIGCRHVQVCAALAAKVHATTPELLLPDAPPEFLCPITKQLMAEPVLLVETGHTYEAAAIDKWLDTSDVCPVNGQKLRRKETAPNFTLKSLITDWATAHGVPLPTAPAYTPHGSRSRAGATSLHDGSDSSSQPSPGAAIVIGRDDARGSQDGKTGGASLCRCTRTRWAILAASMLLAVALAIGLAVGLPMIRRSRGAHSVPVLCAAVTVLIS